MTLYVDHCLYYEDLPADCIEECGSGGGAKDEAVAHWRKALDFRVNRDNAIKCLAGYGAWSREELAEADDDTVAERILWLAASNFAEWDGAADSDAGSDIFVLE